MIQFFDAFISYGRADSKAFATKLQAHLQEQGFRAWFDFNDIPLAVDFQNQIDDGIEKAHHFLFIISPHAVNSPYCRKEIELAIKQGKRIIPLLHVMQISYQTWQQRNPKRTASDWEAYKAKGLHDSYQNMHPTLRRLNWVFFQEDKDDFEKSLADLIKLLSTHTDYVEHHTQFLVQALEWERHQKQTRCLLIGEEKQQAQAWLKIRFKDEQPPCLPTDLHCEYITESIKNGNNLMSEVFLSYADEDRATMEKIRNSLRRESITVWTNRTDVQTGEVFEEAIKRGIEQADNVVYLLSPESVNSTYCKQELDLAVSLNKRIIPVLVRETHPEIIPSALQDLHYIDLTDNVKEEDYLLDESQLLKILHQDGAYYNEHKILLTKALKWKRQQENPTILLRGYNLRSAETWLKVAFKRRQHLPTTLQEEFITQSLRQPPLDSLDVFISYSRADSDFARNLNDNLQIQGKTTWFDQESIASGTDFQQEIYRGIKACDNFLFILSPRSVNSPYCASEVEYAASLNKRFMTVLHREVNTASLHPELAKVQWIDFNHHQRDFNANFNKLLITIDTDREHVHRHTKWLQRALEWEQQGKDKDLLLRGSELYRAQSWLQGAEQNKKQPNPTNLQKEFINNSREVIEIAKLLERRQLVIKSLLGLVSVAFMVGLILGVQAIINEELAKENEKIAKENEKIAKENEELARKEAERANKASKEAETESLKSLSKTSEALFNSNQILTSLIEGIRAGKKLKDSPGYEKDTQNFTNNSPLHKSIVTSLFNSVYLVRERNRFDGHKGLIWDVNFSPDGKMIASVSGDNTIKLWKPDGTLITDIKGYLEGNAQGHKAQVLGVSFHPNGSMIASASDDKTVKLWKADGTFIRTLEGHEKPVDDVSFSPDGNIIASASEDATVKIWKLDGTLVTTIRGHNAAVRDVEFSPEGNILASASDDKAVRLWQKDGRWIRTLRGHNARVYGLSFSRDGETLASASWDQTVRLWKLDGSSKLIRAHNRRVFDVGFSPDGETVASASEDKTIKIWKLDGTLKSTLAGHSSQVRSLSFNDNGKILVSAGGDRTVKLWQLEREAELTIPLQEHRAQVLDVAFSPDGELLASASADKTVKLWKPDGTPIKTNQGHDNVVRSVSFSPDGKILASASSDRTVKLWSREGKILQTLYGHDKPVNDVTFSPDGKLIASGSQDRTVIIWKRDGEKVSSSKKVLTSGNSPESHREGVLSVRFSPDSKTLASTSWDKTVKLWNVDDGILKETISGHDGWVFDAQFGQQGQTITTASYDNTVKLWNTDGKLLKTLGENSEAENKNSEPENSDGHSDGVVGLSFDPNSQTIATASADNTVKLWSKNGSLITTIKGHTDKVNSASFSPDGAMLASASDDNKIILWRLKHQDEFILDLDKLLELGCDWVKDYLKNNQNLPESDSLRDSSASRELCDDIK
ncbi:MAG: TIR domain-containing protein [Symploca sp. SIO2E9]|nr:TIR domain-containing protein [Symploca sp. SIO2E9]